MKTAEEYKPFGMEWELEMLKFKKQDLVEFLRGALSKNSEIISKIEEMIEDYKVTIKATKNDDDAMAYLMALAALTELRNKLGDN